jgi:hypothetical protein
VLWGARSARIKERIFLRMKLIPLYLYVQATSSTVVRSGRGAASSEHVMQGQGCGSLVGYRCMMNRSSAHLGRARQSRGVHVQAVAGPSCWAGAPLRSPKRTRPALGRWWELCTCTAVEFSSSRPFFAPCKAVEKAENSQDWQLD